MTVYQHNGEWFGVYDSRFIDDGFKYPEQAMAFMEKAVLGDSLDLLECLDYLEHLELLDLELKVEGTQASQGIQRVKVDLHIVWLLRQ